MLSQKHDMNFIAYWLGEWLKDNKRPNECITDDSSALLGACVIKFTQFKNINCYLTACMRVLLQGDLDSLPTTFLRLDRSHIIKSIHRNLNKHLKKEFEVKDLYARALGYLCECNDLQEIQKIIELIFIVCRNKYVNENVLEAKNNLLELIKSFQFEMPLDEEAADFNYEKDSDVNFVEKNNSLKDTLNYKWVMKYYYSVEVNDYSTQTVCIRNSFYAPKIDDFLIYMLSRLVLWGNAMCPAYNCVNICPTSSQTESEFKNIKKLLNIQTKRVDLFVKKHLEHIAGQMKLAYANTKSNLICLSHNKRNVRPRSWSLSEEVSDKNTSLEKSRSFSNISLTEENPTASSSTKTDIKCRSLSNTSEEHDPMEDWRKKATRTIKTRRAKNTILEPKNHLKNVPLLLNGYTSKRKIDKRLICSTNTCAFDSIFSIYASYYADYHFNKVNFDKADEPFLHFIQEVLKNTKKDYGDARNEILYSVYSQSCYKHSISYDDNIVHINCSTGIGALFSRMTKFNRMMCSIRIKRSCSKCEYTDEKPFSFVSLNIREMNQNLKNIDQFIVKDRQCSVFCDQCCSVVSEKKIYNDLICFEVEPIQTHYQNANQIEKLKQTIEITRQQYDLFGVVEFKPKINHFVAHVKRKYNTWETYDDLNKTVKISTVTVSKFMYVHLFAFLQKKRVKEILM